MNNDKDEKIRKLAYEIWEREGRPHGRHERHWHQALRESREASGDTTDGTSGQPSGEVASPEPPHSNADARLSGEHTSAIPPPAPSPKRSKKAAVPRPKRPRSPKQ